MVAGTTPAAAPGPELLVGGDEDRTRRRRWPWLLLALVILAALAVRPVLGHLNAAGLGDLRDLWAVRVSNDLARGDALAAVESAAVPTDSAAVRGAAAALDREEADRLGPLRQRIDAVSVSDDSPRSVRAAMAAALAAEMSDLGRTARSGSLDVAVNGEQTAQLIGAAQQRLATAEHDYAVSASTNSPHVTLHAADATTARFQHYLDAPTGGLRLIGWDSSGTALVDIDRNRTENLSFQFPTQYFTSPTLIGGHLVGTFDADTGPTAYAASPRLNRPMRVLGRGTAIPAPGRAAVWVADETGVSLVDPTGRLLMPRAALPPGAATIGAAVRVGLVLSAQGGDASQDPTGLVVWDPLRRRTVRTITTGPGMVIATDADTIAWQPGAAPAAGAGGTAPLHLFDVTTGVDRTVAGADHAYAADMPIAAFSPDGAHLALFLLPPGRDTQFGIVDVRTATTGAFPATSQADPYGDLPMWTPDSSRVFYEAGAWAGLTGVDRPRGLLATYRLGDPAVADLRLPGNYDRLLAVMPAG